jgi:hypothetical protein
MLAFFGYFLYNKNMKLICPQCSANNQIEVPDSFAQCEACESSLYIDIDEITVVYSFTPTIEANQLDMYLKRDFEKIGFNEAIEIRESLPAYFPFWHVEGSRKLERASSHFQDETIDIPSGEKVFFNSASAIEKNIEIIDIDTQPEESRKRTLYYVPFFQVELLFNQKNYTFFINAVNGEVKGEPIPFISSEKTFRLFPWFITIFLLFLIFNSVFDNMLIVIPLCLVTMFIFYQVSLQLLEKRYFKKEK